MKQRVGQRVESGATVPEMAAVLPVTMAMPTGPFGLRRAAAFDPQRISERSLKVATPYVPLAKKGLNLDGMAMATLLAAALALCSTSLKAGPVNAVSATTNDCFQVGKPEGDVSVIDVRKLAVGEQMVVPKGLKICAYTEGEGRLKRWSIRPTEAGDSVYVDSPESKRFEVCPKADGSLLVERRPDFNWKRQSLAWAGVFAGTIALATLAGRGIAKAFDG